MTDAYAPRHLPLFTSRHAHYFRCLVHQSPTSGPPPPTVRGVWLSLEGKFAIIPEITPDLPTRSLSHVATYCHLSIYLEDTVALSNVRQRFRITRRRISKVHRLSCHHSIFPTGEHPTQSCTKSTWHATRSGSAARGCHIVLTGPVTAIFNSVA